MKKKNILVIITLLCIFVSLFAFAGCQNDDTTQHKHSYSDEWQSDAAGHWQICQGCNAESSKQQHSFGDWIIIKEGSCEEDGNKKRICSVCGYEEIQKIVIDHSVSSEWSFDSYSHWKTCEVCAGKLEFQDHAFDSDNICEVCGYDGRIEISLNQISPQVFDYDGTEKSINIKEYIFTDMSDYDFEITYLKNGQETTPVDAGSYDIKIFRARDNKYKEFNALLEGQLVINKVSSPMPEMPIIAPQQYGTNTDNIILPEGFEWKFSQIIDKIGTNVLYAAYIQDENHLPIEVQISIEGIKAVYTDEDIMWNKTTFVYNGEMQGPKLILPYGLEVKKYDYDVQAKAVGNYRISATLEWDRNFVDYSGVKYPECNWSITPIEVQPQINPLYSDKVFSKVYDQNFDFDMSLLPSDLFVGVDNNVIVINNAQFEDRYAGQSKILLTLAVGEDYAEGYVLSTNTFELNGLIEQAQTFGPENLEESFVFEAEVSLDSNLIFYEEVQFILNDKDKNQIFCNTEIDQSTYDYVTKTAEVIFTPWDNNYKPLTKVCNVNINFPFNIMSIKDNATGEEVQTYDYLSLYKNNNISLYQNTTISFDLAEGFAICKEDLTPIDGQSLDMSAYQSGSNVFLGVCQKNGNNDYTSLFYISIYIMNEDELYNINIDGKDYLVKDIKYSNYYLGLDQNEIVIDIGESYFEKYGSRLLYTDSINYDIPVESNIIRLPKEATRFELFKDRSKQIFYINIYQFNGIKSVNVEAFDISNNNIAEYQVFMDGNNLHLQADNIIPQSLSVEFKEECPSGYSYEIVDNQNNPVDFKNFSAWNSFKLLLKNDNDEIYIVMDFNLNINLKDIYSIQSETAMKRIFSGYEQINPYDSYNIVYNANADVQIKPIVGIPDLNVDFDGQQSFTLSYLQAPVIKNVTAEYNGVKVSSVMVFVNENKSFNDVYEEIKFKKTDGNNEVTQYINWEPVFRANGFVEEIVSNGLTEIAEYIRIKTGFTHISINVEMIDQIAFIKLRYQDGEAFYNQWIITSGVEVFNDNTELKAIEYINMVNSQSIKYDPQSESIDIEKANDLNGLFVFAKQSNTKLVLYNSQNELLLQGYNNIDYIFRATGTYKLEIISSDNTKIRRLTINVLDFERSPVVGLIFGEKEYNIYVNEEGMPEANENLQLSQQEESMVFTGYSKEGHDYAIGSIVNAKLQGVSDMNVTDIEGNKLSLGNIELKVQQDEGGKYIGLSIENGFVLIKVYLEAAPL